MNRMLYSEGGLKKIIPIECKKLNHFVLKKMNEFISN